MALTTYDIASADEIYGFGTDTFAPKVCYDSNGRIFVVYVKTESGFDNVYLAYSDDDGATWTEEYIQTGTFRYVSCAVDTSDNVYVTYSNHSAVNTLRQIRRNSNDTWEAEEVVSAQISGNGAYYTSTAIDADGNIWVAATWYDGSKYEIKLHKKVSGSWSIKTTLSAPAGYDYFKHVMKIQGEYCHCLIEKRDTGATSNVNFVYDRFSISGESWSGVDTVCNGVYENNKMYHTLAIESDGTVWCFWVNDGYGTETSYRQIIYNTGTSGSWGSAAALTDDAYDHVYCMAKVNSEDDIGLFYSDKNQGTYWNCLYMVYADGSWGSPVAVTNSTSESRLAFGFDIEEQNKFHYILGIQQGDSTWDLYYAGDDGGISISVTATITETPNIAIAPIDLAAVIAYKTPNESDLPTDKNIDRFVLLQPGDTGEGDAIRIDTWGNVGITCVMASAGSEIEIYVSNDGTNFVLRETFTLSGELNINAAYKYVKAKQISGSAMVIFSGQKTALMY